MHIDAFPSRPMQGWRILRVFANVNPVAPREWRVGEPFELVAKRFLPQIGSPLPGWPRVLALLGITKQLRTPYDHLMLGIHDRMKADLDYQAYCPQRPVSFPAGSTWTCFTDAVSHATVRGQFAFEQTFYIPVWAMRDPSRSPLRIMERLTGRKLVATRN